jgi:hypothetical protein
LAGGCGEATICGGSIIVMGFVITTTAKGREGERRRGNNAPDPAHIP